MTAAVDWHPADILAAIKKQGMTASGLSMKLGYRPSSVGSVINGFTYSERAERLIAREIGVSPQVIWPSRFGADGKRRRGPFPNTWQQKNAIKLKQAAGRRNAQKGRAA
jgi:Ner family transcriptional regulator